jgi:hypothetical protein
MKLWESPHEVAGLTGEKGLKVLAVILEDMVEAAR